MLIVFLDLLGIVRKKFVPRGTTVNFLYYKRLLERLQNGVRRKRPEKWANGFVLHHDNAPTHRFLSDSVYRIKKLLRVRNQHIRLIWRRYFWLFPKFKMTTKGKRFDSREEIEVATTTRLKALTKDNFQDYFKKCHQRWNTCVASQGKYFEGDYLIFVI